MKKYLLSLLIVFGLGFSSAYAAQPAPAWRMLAADQVIHNLSTTLTELKKAVKIQVNFPAKIPAQQGKTVYYASFDASLPNPDILYILSVDDTADCHGVHACNRGQIIVNKTTAPQMYTDRDNKKITVPVQLTNNVQGYYTSGHAMGSYFSPSIQWKSDNLFYEITWNPDFQLSDKEMRKTLISMANSMIAAK